jgi:hypothetical protein
MKKKKSGGREHNVPERPCPFCGCNAHVHRAFEATSRARNVYAVACGAKRCPVQPETAWVETREEAAAIWNGTLAKKQRTRA